MLNEMRIAILVAEGFEQVELTEPRQALDEAGAQTRIVSPATDQVQGWHHFDKGDNFRVDVPLTSANPEGLRRSAIARRRRQPRSAPRDPRWPWISSAHSSTPASRWRPICHGPWTLIEAGAARGRKMTSWPSLKTDLTNAGATWVDEEVVSEQGLVTSRKPKDIPAFNQKMLELFSQSRRLGEAHKAGRSALEASVAPGSM